MSDVRYICLSDIHLGAKYSVLNRLDPDTGEDRPFEASSTLVNVAEALRATILSMGASEPPRLVLLGDVLEMSFADRREITMGFQRFLESFFPPDVPAAFSTEIVLVPGNHDHNLWNTECDANFLNQLQGVEANEIPPLMEVTRAFDKPQLLSSYLTEIMRRYDHLTDASVVIAYPNFGLVNDAGTRAVLMHHGHYVEPLYRLMTEVAAWIDGRSQIDVDVEQLEKENGTWVDFLWSSLGSSGGLSSDVLELYEIMQDTAAMHVATSDLATRLVNQFRDVLPMSGLPDIRSLARRLTKGMLSATLGRASQTERAAFNQYLSAGSLAGLKWYLEGPVHQQIHTELGSKIPEDVTFVFGHTHKPFEELIPMAMDKYRMPVRVLNTGGWVLDQPRQASTQGAAAVLIDSDLNTAALRLFNNTLSGEDSQVHVRRPVGNHEDNALESLMRTTLSSTRGDSTVRASWAAFSAEVHDALDLRASLMSRRYFDPESDPPVRASRLSKEVTS